MKGNKWSGSTRAIDRLLDGLKTHPSTLATECWISTLKPSDQGYVRLSLGGRHGAIRRGHAIAYEHFIGPVPAGLVLDHLCRNRACVNPAHLEAVTQRENTLRGEHPNVIIRRSGKCARGHEPTDVYVDRDGHPQCRICRRLTRPSRRAT